MWPLYAIVVAVAVYRYSAFYVGFLLDQVLPVKQAYAALLLAGCIVTILLPSQLLFVGLDRYQLAMVDFEEVRRMLMRVSKLLDQYVIKVV